MGVGWRSAGRETETEARQKGRVDGEESSAGRASGKPQPLRSSSGFCCLSPRLAFLRAAAQGTAACCRQCCQSCSFFPSGSPHHRDAVRKSGCPVRPHLQSCEDGRKSLPLTPWHIYRLHLFAEAAGHHLPLPVLCLFTPVCDGSVHQGPRAPLPGCQTYPITEAGRDRKKKKNKHNSLLGQFSFVPSKNQTF